jgi:hypothetical protein
VVCSAPQMLKLTLRVTASPRQDLPAALTAALER